MKNSANFISQNWVYWRTITRRNLPSGSIKTEEVSYLKEWFNQESIYLVRPTDLSSTLWFLRNQNLFSHSKVLEWLKQQKKYLDKYVPNFSRISAKFCQKNRWMNEIFRYLFFHKVRPNEPNQPDSNSIWILEPTKIDLTQEFKTDLYRDY